jgi:hypothetical protein
MHWLSPLLYMEAKFESSVKWYQTIDTNWDELFHKKSGICTLWQQSYEEIL